MLELSADEARVLGVLIEKGATTPDQYPLSLNATVNGCNQKNNRQPVLSMSEDAVHTALEKLREQGLVVRVDTPGSRVHKYRHEAGAKLGLSPRELAVMAELMMRGPQTLGELRGRADRMYPLESLEVVRSILDNLGGRPEPLVRPIAPEPGSRAGRFAQLLAPTSHPLPTTAAGEANLPFDSSPRAAAAAAGVASDVVDRIDQLESELAETKAALRKLALSLGESDPFAEE
jgi:uncharacterized protein YceH (UPF0502 family)